MVSHRSPPFTPDGVTIQRNALTGVVSVMDQGIDTAQLKDLAVTNSKVAAAADIANSKLASEARRRNLGGSAKLVATITNAEVFAPAQGAIDQFAGGSDALFGTPWPWTGNIEEFHCALGLAVTAGHILTVKVYVNGVAQATLQLAIANADGTTLKSAVGAAVAVVKGDRVSVSFQKDTAGAQTLRPGWFFRGTPTGV